MLSLWFEQALLPSGWAPAVLVEARAGVITAVHSHAAPTAESERHTVAVPGVADLHSHAFQRAAAGRTGVAGPAGDSFWTWRAEIYRLAASLRPDDLAAIAALAYAEMLEAGFTRVGEFHYLHHAPDGGGYDDPGEMAARCLEAAETTGIDITLLPVFYAHSGFGGAAPKPEQRRFVCGLDGYAELLGACRDKAAQVCGAIVGVAPHSLRAVTPHELAHVAAMAPGGPIHIHASEQTAEVEASLAALGARPVAWLLANCDVDRRWCLVHATHVDPDELRGLAASGATVGLCPITEADLGDGVFPAVDYARLGGVWGVGSDSNVRIDLAGELRLLEYGQRLVTQRRNVLAEEGRSSGRSLHDAARRGGSRALGHDADAIAAGEPATFVSLNTTDPAFLAARGDTTLDAWIFAARRPAVDRVWRRGRLVVRDGLHLRRSEIERAYRTRMAGILGDDRKEASSSRSQEITTRT